RTLGGGTIADQEVGATWGGTIADQEVGATWGRAPARRSLAGLQSSRETLPCGRGHAFADWKVGATRKLASTRSPASRHPVEEQVRLRAAHRDRKARGWRDERRDAPGPGGALRGRGR